MNDPIAERHWAVAMEETVCVSGCTCIFCTRRSDVSTETERTRTTPRSRPRRHIRRSLPSTDSIMEVLYPSSFLGTPPAFREPPSYLAENASPSDTRRDHRERAERTPLISSMTTTEGTPVPSSLHDPLVEPPSLTGVPSSGTSSGRVLPAEPNDAALQVGLGIDVLGDRTEAPPAYSRFDDSKSRLPIASEVLGPYPPMSALTPSAR